MTEVQFGGDYTAFPLWGRDESGYFDRNLPSLRPLLPVELALALDAWVKRWAEVDGGDREGDTALTEVLIAEGRQLASRVGEELGSDYVVSVRWDATR